MELIIQEKITSLVKDINERVKIILVTQEIENEFLHDLRLSIKNFKALYKLCKGLSIPISKHAYKTIQEIHSVAGTIRDAQVQQELLTDIEKFTKQSFKKLRLILEKKESNAKKKLQEVSFEELENPSISTNVRVSHIEELMEETLYKAHQLDDLHEQRKWIKTSMYWTELLLIKNPENEEWEEKRIELKQRASLIGEWHDYINLMECIKDNDLTSKKYLYLLEMIKYKNLILLAK